MAIDERMLKSVIEEVLKEMAGEKNSEPVKTVKKEEIPSEVNSLVVTEVGEFVPSNRADEVVIGLAPAFGVYQTKTIIGTEHAKVLKEIIAGIEEEGLSYRFVKIYRTSDVCFIAHDAAELSGSGVGIGIQSKGTTVIQDRKSVV